MSESLMTVVHLEELQTRTAFVREVAEQRRAYIVEGTEGVARVLSPRNRGQSVELIWSNRAEAARWADVLVTDPKITELPIEALLSRHLPRAAGGRLRMGVDWSASLAEPEITAGDLDQQVRRRLLDQLVESATKTRQVWLLKSGDTPATLVTRNPAGSEALPVFADRQSAESAIEGPWNQTVATRVPIGDFLHKTLIWCIETRRRIAPAYVAGPGLMEVPPWDMKALLAGHPPARRVA
jgi:Protein of unknown function (DUF2750)